MIPSARLGDSHVCPLPGHGTTPVVAASPDTLINTLGAARVGDVCGCGAVITAGFPSININGRPLAHLDSPTSHGGRIVTGSPDTFGGFTGAGSVLGGTGAIVDFARLGAIRPDGSVDERRMAELLADPQIEQRALLSDALVRPSRLQSPTASEPRSPELIAVAGSQYDNSASNKMMFIGQAVRELGEFQRSKPDLSRTLAVFTPGYSEAMLNAARASAQGYGADFVALADVRELIDYLNGGKDREQFPIEHLSLFSHGVPQQVAFGYELARAEWLSLDALNYSRISPQAFSRTARLDSYACRTGMGNRPDLPIEEAVQLFPQTSESLAQLLADHLRIRVRAFIRRSDYRNTWGSFEERRMGQLCSATADNAPSTEWCRRWQLLDKERTVSIKKKGFVYQKMGAIDPVISGDTPLGVPGGLFEFLPK
jgi:hypothetical protein